MEGLLLALSQVGRERWDYWDIVQTEKEYTPNFDIIFEIDWCKNNNWFDDCKSQGNTAFTKFNKL